MMHKACIGQYSNGQDCSIENIRLRENAFCAIRGFTTLTNPFVWGW